MTNAGPLLATSGAVICARTVLPDTTVVARMDPFQYTAAFGPKPYHWTVRVKPLLPEATLAGTSGRTNQRGTRHQLGNLSATSRPSSVPSLAKNRVSDNVGPCQVTYGVVASKIDDGYADFGLTAPVKVTITPEEPLASVILKLGPRAGILIPLVKNKITGKPVSDFLVAYQDRPGNKEIQLSILYNAKRDLDVFADWQDYFRKQQPPTLITWGKNDGIFTVEGAELFKRDIPSAELHLFDTGHFALEEEVDRIGSLMHEFLDRTTNKK